MTRLMKWCCVVVAVAILSFGRPSATQTAEEWASLNCSVKGRLHLTPPLALPCFSDYNGKRTEFEPVSCSLVRNKYGSSSVRASEAGSYENLQSEICLSDPADQCILDGTQKPAGLPAANDSCRQGSIPTYHVVVQADEDVVAVLQFAKNHGVPLAIKSSGHDWMTRSSQKGGLGVWVHKLQGLKHHANFTPAGCAGVTNAPALTVAAGVDTETAMKFASDHGTIFVGGYSPTIAPSGGFVQGGGHSVLSPAWGLAADRVLEFKLVTPDGVVRIANQCQHRDLFWALRGGGGGTFGVVLEATHRVEPVTPVAVASIRLPDNATVDQSLAWIELMARQSLRWGREGWGGHAAGLYLTYMNPLAPIANLGDGGAAARLSMEAASVFATSIGGNSTVEVLPNYYDVWTKYVVPAPAGQVRMLQSRLIPNSLFETDEGIGKIMGFVRAVQELGISPRTLYVPVDTPFVADGSAPSHEANKETSVHSAWYRSLWSISHGISIAWKASYAERLANMTVLGKVTQLAEELTGSDGGAYANEANLFTTHWREQWWGEKYDELLRIKNKYDPDGLLKCWKCVAFDHPDVGSERFRCLGKMQLDLTGIT